MTVRVVVPVGVTDGLRELVGMPVMTAPLATVGGYSNLSYHVELDGRPVVVKAATLSSKRADLRREARMLSLLALPGDITLPVPLVIAHGDYGDWTVTVLDFVAGEHGLAALEFKPLANLESRAILLARLLQAVQSAAPQPVLDPDLDIPTRVAELRPFVESVDVLPDVRALMIASIESTIVRRGVALVHGDFGLHNVLWRIESKPARVGLAALLDWEFAGWGCPLTDVAWLWWTLRFRGIADRVWVPFVEAYGDWALRGIGFEAANVLDLVRVQMIQLLSRTDPASAAHGEWLRRWDALRFMPDPSTS